jgi:Leucine-rich repeat (LRR) protein
MHVPKGFIDLSFKQIASLDTEESKVLLNSKQHPQAIRLSYNKLTTLPSLPNQFNNVKWLDLSFNQMSDIPMVLLFLLIFRISPRFLNYEF